MQYGLVFIGCVLVIDALVGDKGVLQMLKTRQKAQSLYQAVAVAQTKNGRLRDQIKRFKVDPAALEDAARRDLGLIKPGEKLFIVRGIPAWRKHH